MKTKALKTKFIFAFLITLFLVVVILITVFEVGFRLIIDGQIKQNMFAMQDALDESVAEVVNESAYLYTRMSRSSNEPLLSSVADEQLTDEERAEAFKSLIVHTGVNREYFDDVILEVNGKRFSMTGEIQVPGSVFEHLMENPNDIVFAGVYSQSVVTGLYSPVDFGATFLFCLNERRISEMCASSSGGEGYSFLMRGDGLIISHPDGVQVGKSIIYSDIYNVENAPQYKKDRVDGVRSIIVISETDLLNSRYSFGGYLISVLDYNFYFGVMDTALWVLIGAAVGVFAVAAVLAVIRARKISQPITALSDAINSIEEPTREKLDVLDGKDELVLLERNYDAMMERICDLVDRNKEDMQKQRKLELDSLQMQINPHFLYNTLDAISWMAKIKKQPEIDRLVINLARFFRLSLHNGDKFITVREEAELVKSYLEIDKIRFPERVTEHIEIDEAVADKLILKLIVQPIVENCLKYAFTGRKGNLWIRAYGKGDDIIIEVEDDGAGFEVPEDILTRAPKKEGGYGLINVNERIKLQYGEGYGLTVVSRPGEGTKVIIRLKDKTA